MTKHTNFFARLCKRPAQSPPESDSANTSTYTHHENRKIIQINSAAPVRAPLLASSGKNSAAKPQPTSASTSNAKSALPSKEQFKKYMEEYGRIKDGERMEMVENVFPVPVPHPDMLAACNNKGKGSTPIDIPSSKRLPSLEQSDSGLTLTTSSPSSMFLSAYPAAAAAATVGGAKTFSYSDWDPNLPSSGPMTPPQLTTTARFFDIFETSSPQIRQLILKQLLDGCTHREIRFVNSLLEMERAGLGSISKKDTRRLSLSYDQIIADPFFDLADELIVGIFAYLDSTSLARSARVNKRWNRILRDNALWHSICKTHDFEPIPKRKPAKRPKLLGTNASDGEHPQQQQHLAPVDNHSSVTPPSNSSHSSSPWIRVHRKRNSYNYRRNSPELFRDMFWKQVFHDCFVTERNWRTGNCRVQAVLDARRDYGGHLCMSFDITSGLVVSAPFGENAKVWDMYTGQSLFPLLGHNGVLSAVKLNHKYIVSGGIDHTIKIWDTSNGQCLRTLHGHEGEIPVLQFKCIPTSNKATGSTSTATASDEDYSYAQKNSEVSHVIVSGSEDRTIRVWGLETGECLAVLRGHTGTVTCLQFNGTKVISGSTDRTIRIWDIPSATCVSTLGGHEDYVFCLDFDSRYIVTGSQDNSVKVWDVKTGDLLKTLRGHRLPVVCLQFDGQKIVTGAIDRTIKVYEDNCKLRK
ncbi:hypothetical protein HK102_011735 [Quaeritorhiza haematococci]|nr:hypothetical protein HK102_011735 [Quaeritorhiza haematococci]